MRQPPTPDHAQNHVSEPWLSELDRITELVGNLAGKFELVQLLERVLGHAVALLHCKSSSISIVHETEGYYRKEVDQGVGCHLGQTFALTESLSGQIVATRNDDP